MFQAVFFKVFHYLEVFISKAIFFSSHMFKTCLKTILTALFSSNGKLHAFFPLINYFWTHRELLDYQSFSSAWTIRIICCKKKDNVSKWRLKIWSLCVCVFNNSSDEHCFSDKNKLGNLCKLHIWKNQSPWNNPHAGKRGQSIKSTAWLLP